MKKHYTSAFKAQIVQEVLKEDKPLSQIAAEYGVHPNQLSKSKATALKGLPSLFDENKAIADLKAAHDKQVDDLYSQIGRLSTQLAWLKKNYRCKSHSTVAVTELTLIFASPSSAPS